MSLEEFFTVIKDGTWHNIEELSDKLDLSLTRLVKISNFLSQHGLLKYEEESNKIRLEPKWRLLLPQEEPTEPKTTTTRHKHRHSISTKKKPNRSRPRNKPEN